MVVMTIQRMMKSLFLIINVMILMIAVLDPDALCGVISRERL
jgi:hypothetical protein